MMSDADGRHDSELEIAPRGDGLTVWELRAHRAGHALRLRELAALAIRVRWPLAVTAYSVLAWLAISKAPGWFESSLADERALAAERASIRTTALALIAAAGAAVGLLIQHRNHRHGVDSEERLEVDRRHARELGRRTFVASRFSGAVEQLANSDPTIKLAGIYSLGSIAKEDEAQRAAILDILNAYVTPYSEPSELEEEENPGPPPAEVCAAFIVLARIRGRDHSPRARLVGANLTRADLTQLNLRQARFRGAVLTGADLRWTDLQAADLSEVSLEFADLSDSHIEMARFAGADLTDAKLDGLWANGTNFANACLWRASCRDAGLSGANFEDANLAGADLHGAIIRREQLSESQIAQIVGEPRWISDRDIGPPS